MGDSDENSEELGSKLSSRVPEEDDLVSLCRELNRLGARYVIVGGWAVIKAGYARATEDVDLIIDTSPENEAKVFEALETLPDKAVLGLDPGDVEKFTVVRICDEITVDLMYSACGVKFDEAEEDIVFRKMDGVEIPFASPRLLWKTKKPTNREKDIPDLYFLREWFLEKGEDPPNI